MRVIVIGLGVQGHKRRRFAGADFVADGRSRQRRGATTAASRTCRSTRYDAALACIPDEPKVEVLQLSAPARQARAGREAAVQPRTTATCGGWSSSRATTARSATPPTTTASSRTSCACATSSPRASSAASTAAACSTATAPRGWCATRRGATRAPASCPTSARTCSTRRGSGSATSPTTFESSPATGSRTARPTTSSSPRAAAQPRLELEMTLLSWRNHFTCDVLAENGAAHIRSLCKWGPSTFTHRTRVLPSGRPPEELGDAGRGRPDLGARIRALQGAVRDGAHRPTCRTISGSTARSAASAGRAREASLVTAPLIGFAGLTHLGIVSAVRSGGEGLPPCSASTPTRRASRRSRPGGCRSPSPGSTTSPAPTPTGCRGPATRRRSRAATSSTSRPTCRPTTAARATSPVSSR